MTPQEKESAIPQRTVDAMISAIILWKSFFSTSFGIPFYSLKTWWGPEYKSFSAYPYISYASALEDISFQPIIQSLAIKSMLNLE